LVIKPRLLLSQVTDLDQFEAYVMQELTGGARMGYGSLEQVTDWMGRICHHRPDSNPHPQAIIRNNDDKAALYLMLYKMANAMRRAAAPPATGQWTSAARSRCCSTL
jgi:hypothetical protein